MFFDSTNGGRRITLLATGSEVQALDAQQNWPNTI